MLIAFIEKLVQEMSDVDNWGIDGIVEVKEFQNNGKTYGTIEGDPRNFEKSGEEFIHQTSGYSGDDYSGNILIPIEGGKYLKVNYQC